MLRVVLLAACSPNVVAFKQRLFDKQADGSTGPTSRSLMFATLPQKNDGCDGGEVLVRHHDDYSCSCESPQDGCMQDKDCDADQSCSEEGGSEGPQKMTYSSNAGSGAASSHLDFVNVNPGASKARCTNPEIASGDGKADLAACKARCAADPTCAFIVHWSDNGCQRFTSCTQGTHTWGVDSTVYQVRLPCVQPLWSSSPVSGASVKIKADVECKSSDEWLGSFSTLEKCAAACAAKDGCEHFIYGKASGPKGDKAGRCYWEKTSDSSCSSGWEADSYDFYGFKSAGWSRMEGGGQGGTGSWSTTPGYTYHQGAAQPCTSGHFWNNDDGRTCKRAESSTCPCQYGVCPAGYKVNQENAPSGWVEGELPGSAHDSGISSRRRYPYPKGHYYPSSCPCMPTTSLTVYRSGYQNPCPSSHPFLEKYSTTDSYWCYERAGNGGPCKMSDSGIAPPPDGTWGANQADCTLTTCPANHHVSGGKCAACPAGSINAAGDRIADGDSSCTCPANYHVSGGTCIACPTGSINDPDQAVSCADTDDGVSDNGGYSCRTYTQADCGGYDTDTFKSGEMCCVCEGGDKVTRGGDRIADGDSSCTCPVDYHVSGGECVACPAGSWNAGGDRIADGDSSCTCLVDFEVDYHVSSGECVACPTGSISAAGAKIADGDSICKTCPADHHVAGGKCVACPDGCYYYHKMCRELDHMCDILASDCSECGVAELEARVKGLEAMARFRQAPPVSPPPPAGPISYACGCDE